MVRRLRAVLMASVLSSAMCGMTAGPTGAQETGAIAGASPASLSEDYRQFHDHVVEISKLRLDQAENVKRAQPFSARRASSSYRAAGVAAFAEIASQSTRFSAGLKKAASKSGTQSLIAELQSNPSSVFSISGVDTAEKDVMSAISEDSAIYGSLTYRLSEIAYGRVAKEADLARQAQSQPYAAGVTGATRPTAPLSRARRR